MHRSKDSKSNQINANIGQRIRHLRVEAGYSQATLAQYLDISFQQLQKHENGTNRVSASALWQIAQCLQQPITAFYPSEALPSTTEAIHHDAQMLRLIRVLQSLSPNQRRATLRYLTDLAKG